MSGTESTYKQIIRYLKGILSNRERYDLEKEMMRDAFDEEAFEGLSELSAGELKSDMDVLMQRLDNRINAGKRRYLTWYYKIAASVILLAGIGSLLFLLFRPSTPELITQKTKSIKPVTIPIEAKSDSGSPVIAESGQVSKEKKSIQQSETGKKEIVVMDRADEFVITPDDVIMVMDEDIPAVAETTASEIPPSTIAELRSEQVAFQNSAKGFITGRITDADGEALPGVNIVVRGITAGTITDMDGNFSLQVDDSNAILDLNYIGYIPLELSSRDIEGQNIIMQEDLQALDEVVVVGYGTQKKRHETGAVSRVTGDELTEKAAGAEPYNFIRPVPPGGSLKSFKTWVNEQINTSQFKSFSGKHRMNVTLTVQADGSIRNIKIRSSAPEIITKEYERIIAVSPRWKPALKNNIPVDSEVVIRFQVNVE